MFKKETEAQIETASKAVEGGASVKGGKGAVLLYGNYDQYDGISKDIFGAHPSRLAEIKKHYDPKNMFNKVFAIQPAAWTAICKQQKIELSKINTACPIVIMPRVPYHLSHLVTAIHTNSPPRQDFDSIATSMPIATSPRTKA
ncbi:hypothetical protein LTR74_018701 [Friedmanniomyces endolithicus]|nr:hypothetical protein LTR74_018701 [Friedmanniomyces endolithicus]